MVARPVKELTELPTAGTVQHGLLAGPVGAIECMVAAPRAADIRGIAVVCHPHPLYGGAMSNKVVYSVATAALRRGLLVARFNFRGVGKSQGKHDSGRGETEDCLAVVDWMKSRAAGCPLLLAGFSFGAFIGLNASARAHPDALISVAPPFGRYFDGAPNPPHPGCPWIVLHSTDDDVVDYEESRSVLMGYQPAPELVSFDTAGHFFHGQLVELQNTVSPFLANVFAP